MHKVAFISNLSTVPPVNINNSNIIILQIGTFADDLAIKKQLNSIVQKTLPQSIIIDDFKNVKGQVGSTVIVDKFGDDRKLHVVYIDQKIEVGWTKKYIVPDNRIIGFFTAVNAENLPDETDEMKNLEKYLLDTLDENVELRNMLEESQVREEKSADNILDITLKNLELSAKINELQDKLLIKNSPSDEISEIISTKNININIPIKTFSLDAAQFDKSKLLTREQRNEKLLEERIKKMKAIKERNETMCLTSSGLLF